MFRPRFRLRLSTLIWITAFVTVMVYVATAMRHFEDGRAVTVVFIFVTVYVWFAKIGDLTPMPSPQFRLRSLFILTTIVAVGCWVGPPIVREVRMVLGGPEHDDSVESAFTPDTKSRPVLSTAPEYKRAWEAARAAQFPAEPPTE